MITEKIKYPQYRKYRNKKSYFKIISESEFEEIQIIESKITLHLFEAKILPDRNYIYDLTFNYSDYWLICNEDEYESLRKKSIHS